MTPHDIKRKPIAILCADVNDTAASLGTMRSGLSRRRMPTEVIANLVNQHRAPMSGRRCPRERARISKIQQS